MRERSGTCRWGIRASPAAAAVLAEHLGDTAQVLVPFEILQHQRKLAPPVGMLIDGAGNINLIKHAHDVIERNHDKTARCLRQETGNRSRFVASMGSASARESGRP